MTIETKSLERTFRYNSVDLIDPGPQFNAEQVRDFYSATYPEILNAAIEGPEEKDGKLVYAFRKAVGTKGSDTVDGTYANYHRTAVKNGWPVPPEGSVAASWKEAWIRYWVAMGEYKRQVAAGNPDPGRPVVPHRSAVTTDQASPIPLVRGSIARLRADRTTVPQLMNAAAQDPDPCSVFADGSGWHDAGGAIIVIKGGAVAREVVEWLESRGLITKPGSAALQAAKP